jgi:NAD(P)-dependent dehydrogenase (short-subunit alcohol dehydrogenase family)
VARKNLSGKVVGITGGATGIGRALAKEFLRAGATLWIIDRNEEAIADFVDEAHRYDLPLQVFVGDVTLQADLQRFVDKILAEHRHIDWWINNAGIAINGAFVEIDAESFERVLDINLHAVIRCTRLLLAVMERSGQGCIVNIASVAGHIAPPLMTAYATSKHGVVGFTRSLAAELDLKSSPVKLVLVSPGFVDTGIVMKGQKGGFPEWLSWMLTKPERVAREIFRGIMSGRQELTPTLNGKVMMGIHKALPGRTVRGSRILLAKSWKDLFMNRLDS